MRAAIYTRVSTDDGRQTADNQRLELESFAAARGWQIVENYTDQMSGAKGRDQRAGYAQLFKDANQAKFDVVLVWALDRFTREGIGPALLAIEELEKQGIEFHSYTEPILQSTGPHSPIMRAMVAFIGDFERKRNTERIRAGVRRAQAAGIHCGRTRNAAIRAKVQELRASGKTLRQIATLTGIAHPTVCRYLKEKKAA